MLKKPLLPVALCLSLFFAPALAQAAPWKLSRSEPRLTAPPILSVLAGWWSSLVGEERTGTAVQEKNGCGIDPNGQPLCGEGGGPGTGANPPEDPGTEG